jgi:hypothetical protein
MKKRGLVTELVGEINFFSALFSLVEEADKGYQLCK